MSSTESGELLGAVRQFLNNDVLPELEGFKAYNTRVAANALAIVSREIELAPAREVLDGEAVSAFALDSASPVTVQLAKKLREGELDVSAQLVDWLKRHTLLSLAVDNPRYAGFLEASERWQEPEAE